MKTKSLLIALLSIIIFLTGCGKPEWKPFSSPDGRFSVLMPRTPSQDSATTNTEGGIATIHYYMVEQNNLLYGVTCIDYPNAIGSTFEIDARLDQARDSKVSRGTLLYEQAITLADHPGRAIRFEDSDGKLHCSRFFVAEARLYTVDVITSKYDSSSVDISRFLDSFSFTQSGVTAQHVEKHFITVGAFTVKVPSDWRSFSPGESDQFRRQVVAQSQDIYQQYSGAPDQSKLVDIAGFHISGDAGTFAIASLVIPPQSDLINLLKHQAEDKAKWGVQQGYIQKYLGLVQLDDEQVSGFYVKCVGTSGELQVSAGLEHKKLKNTLVQLTLFCPKAWDESKATNTLNSILASLKLEESRQDTNKGKATAPQTPPDDTRAIVIDRKNGLIWQRNAVRDIDQRSAVTYCEGLELAGRTDWRLPTKDELIAGVRVLPHDEGYDQGRTFILWSSTETRSGFAMVVFRNTTTAYGVLEREKTWKPKGAATIGARCVCNAK